MKTFLKISSLITAGIIALSTISCNSISPLTDTNQNLTPNIEINDFEVVENNTEGAQINDETKESTTLSKDILLINPNGIVEESKRAALESGVYMPDPVMNGAPAGTYPIQGFLLSASTPSDAYGNGMSIIYRLSDGSLLVFDGGGGYVKYMLYKCLKDISGGGTIKVAAWVMTHAHGDHFGAMKSLLEGAHQYDFEIREFWYNRATNTSESKGDGVALENLFKKVAKGDTKVRALTYGQTYTLDGGRVTAKVLCTPSNISGRSGIDENTNSLVMMLNIGGKKLLMTGDANEPAWDFMVSQHNKNSEYSLKCDYLQMPHHAVQSAGTTAGYNAADPSYVIIPSTTGLAKTHCTSSNASPTYNFLKNKMNINTQASYLPQMGSNYCYAGNYTQNGTKNVICFFTSTQ